MKNFARLSLFAIAAFATTHLVANSRTISDLGKLNPRVVKGSGPPCIPPDVYCAFAKDGDIQ